MSPATPHTTMRSNESCTWLFVSAILAWVAVLVAATLASPPTPPTSANSLSERVRVWIAFSE